MDTSVTVISDTHGRHGELDLSAGDLLIHCGDMFDLFGDRLQSLAAMDDWLGRQRFELILCTGGNHDRLIEAELARNPQPLQNAYFLRDEVVEFRGLKIFGAPWVPDLPTHAFFKDSRGLAEKWAQIPSDVDILITHTPPKGVLDISGRGWSHGCQALADEISRISPRVHCFGYVHASAGYRNVGQTLFINASSVESGTGRVRAPMTLSLSSR